MQLGVTFPTHEIGTDPGAIRAFVQGVEEMGFSHISAYDHVIGADPDARPGFDYRYTVHTPFHEPLTLLSFIAACTRRIGLVSAVLVLPMRQTVLVAKQAAELDILSSGRLRLGVGLGRNAIEYEAMGADFRSRGRRIEEQIALLRALWSQQVVDFRGAGHTLDRAGINPLPLQRPIPIWFGGRYDSEAALRRIARLSGRWLWYAPPTSSTDLLPAPNPQEVIKQLHQYVREAGRDPSSVPLEGQTSIAHGTPERWRRAHAAWKGIGAGSLALNTMGTEFASADQHLQRLREARGAFA